MEYLRDFKDVLLVLNTLAIIVVAIAAWLRKPGIDAEAAVKTLSDGQARLHEEHRMRLTMVESQLKHMPTKDELTELEGTVKAINERTEGMDDAMKRITHQLDLIQRYLMERK